MLGRAPTRPGAGFAAGLNLDVRCNGISSSESSSSESDSSSSSDEEGEVSQAVGLLPTAAAPVLTQSRFAAAVFFLMADGVLPVNREDKNHAGRLECIASKGARTVVMKKSEGGQGKTEEWLDGRAAKQNNLANSKTAVMAGIARFGELYQRSHDEGAAAAELEPERRLDRHMQDGSNFSKKQYIRQYWVSNCKRVPDGSASQGVYTLDAEQNDEAEFQSVVSHLRRWASAQKFAQRDDDTQHERRAAVPPPMAASPVASPGKRGPKGQKTSKYVGVFWQTKSQRWIVTLGKATVGGIFADEKAAARAFDDAARRSRGAAAHGRGHGRGRGRFRLNFPTEAEAQELQRSMCVTCKVARAVSGMRDSFNRRQWCAGCAKDVPGTVNIDAHEQRLKQKETAATRSTSESPLVHQEKAAAAAGLVPPSPLVRPSPVAQQQQYRCDNCAKRCGKNRWCPECMVGEKVGGRFQSVRDIRCDDCKRCRDDGGCD